METTIVSEIILGGFCNPIALQTFYDFASFLKEEYGQLLIGNITPIENFTCVENKKLWR